MNKMKQHWEEIFQQKTDHQKSWFQPYPSTSIKLIEEINLDKNAAIIDVGGGDSRLIDNLIEKGYTNVTVLDISSNALENAKIRLGDNAKKVKWAISNILNFRSDQQFDLWHDRAAFHFITTDKEIEKYVETSYNIITTGGYLIIGTFSEKGPQKCSGLDIKQYSEDSMSARFEETFEKIICLKEDHITPSGNKQNFLFCIFKKRNK